MPHYWPSIEGWIVKALSHGSICWAPEDIRHALMVRSMQLWLALDGDNPRACAVTRFETGPRARLCVVMLIGGEGVDDWLAFEAGMTEWARSMGADALEGPGRRGWEPRVSHLGWKPVWTVYRKLLRDKSHETP